MTGLRALIGDGQVDNDDKFARRMRLHQGWWRACVLDVPAGQRSPAGGSVCNSLPSGVVAADDSLNFLTKDALDAARSAVADRGPDAAGIVQKDRLFGNLLSSQPLAFNFFGPLARDMDLASRVLPGLLGLGDVCVKAIHFEHAHCRTPIDDNTAFDVAVEFERDGHKGLVGIECKYTEPFSPTLYDKPRYQEVHAASEAFIAGYDELKQTRYNQLLRTHLLSQALRLKGALGEVHTCLFSSPMKDDKSAAIGQEFAGKVRQLPDSRFFLVNFAQFITHVQRQELSWTQREWSMKLWARYCATDLSERAVSKKPC